MYVMQGYISYVQCHTSSFHSNPPIAMKAVRCLDCSSSSVWWYPAVKSSRANIVGVRVSSLVIVCCMFGIGQPSSPPVAVFSLTKSRVIRHLPGDLRTGCIWLQWVARDSSMTPSFSKASTWVLIAACFPRNGADVGVCYQGAPTSFYLFRSPSASLLQEVTSVPPVMLAFPRIESWQVIPLAIRVLLFGDVRTDPLSILCHHRPP